MANGNVVTPTDWNAIQVSNFQINLDGVDIKLNWRSMSEPEAIATGFFYCQHRLRQRVGS